MLIHASAVIDRRAEIDESVEVGPFCVIGPEVKMAKGVKLKSNVMIDGKTEIGESTQIFPFACIGKPPQDLRYKGEPTGLKIGKENIIREYATIHCGSVGGDGVTTIGDNNYLCAYVHIGHDCRIGNRVVITNSATLGGHVQVEDYAYIGGLSAIQPFTRIGAYAMVGGFSGIGQDIPPYTLSSGARAMLFGLNLVGLKRRGFSDETISELKKAYRILFREKNTPKQAIKKIQEELPDTSEIRYLINFINQGERDICKSGQSMPEVEDSFELSTLMLESDAILMEEIMNVVA